MAFKCREEIILVESFQLLSGEHRRGGSGNKRIEVSVQWDKEFSRA